jgi:hypothetical protein
MSDRNQVPGAGSIFNEANSDPDSVDQDIRDTANELSFNSFFMKEKYCTTQLRSICFSYFTGWHWYL